MYFTDQNFTDHIVFLSHPISCNYYFQDVKRAQMPQNLTDILDKSVNSKFKKKVSPMLKIVLTSAKKIAKNK